jgi:hypothetical protein
MGLNYRSERLDVLKVCVRSFLGGAGRCRGREKRGWRGWVGKGEEEGIEKLNGEGWEMVWAKEGELGGR